MQTPTSIIFICSLLRGCASQLNFATLNYLLNYTSHLCPIFYLYLLYNSAFGITALEFLTWHQPPSVHQNSAGYTLDHTGSGLKSENMGQPMGASLPNTFANGGSSLHPCMQNAVDMSAHARRIDVSPSMLLAQSSNVGMMGVMNGGMIKSEAGYGGSSQYMFGNGGNGLETRPVIGDPPVSSFSSVESNSHPMNDPLLDAESNSFGFLGQIPRNFSLSDLTADFSNSSGTLSLSLSRCVLMVLHLCIFFIT